MSFLMVSVLFLMCVSSCSKDESQSKPNSIVGTWVRDNTTMVLGGNGSYLSTTKDSYGTQTRRGSYSYNDAQKTLVINVPAVQGSNSAYSITLIVQTLTATNLVLIYTDGDVEGYYTRK